MGKGVATKFQLGGGDGFRLGDGFRGVKITFPQILILLGFRPLYFENTEKSKKMAYLNSENVF